MPNRFSLHPHDSSHRAWLVLLVAGALFCPACNRTQDPIPKPSQKSTEKPSDEKLGREERAEFAGRYASDWIQDLKSEDTQLRQLAYDALAQIGPSAKAAAPLLTEALGDEDWAVREIAAVALGRIGAEAQAAIPKLAAALSDPEAGVRMAAAFGLGGIGPKASTALKQLELASNDPDHRVRVWAAYALWKIDQRSAAMTDLTALLRGENFYVGAEAVLALELVGAGSKATIPALVEALGSRVRGEASQALSVIGDAAIGPLASALGHKDKKICIGAARALGAIGPKAATATPALIKAFEDENSEVRFHVAVTLGKIGSGAAAATPALAKALQDPKTQVGEEAARSLGAIGPKAKGATTALIEVLQDRKSSFRRFAAKALGDIGPEAKAAVGPLIKALKAEGLYSSLPSFAEYALGHIGKNAVPQLIVALESEDKMVRFRVAVVLKEIGPDARAAVPALSKTVKDADKYERREAIDALGAIGADAKDAGPALVVALASNKLRIRCAAAAALVAIGVKAKGVIPALIEALNDEHDHEHRGEVESGWFENRKRYVDALVQLGKEATPQLVAALESKHARVRYHVALALGEIGSNAKTAIDALVKASRDDDVQVRRAAVEALKLIDPDAAKKPE